MDPGQYVFPAPAGMNRLTHDERGTSGSVPRASGDEPQLPGGQSTINGCSPRQRG